MLKIMATSAAQGKSLLSLSKLINYLDQITSYLTCFENNDMYNSCRKAGICFAISEKIPNRFDDVTAEN